MSDRPTLAVRLFGSPPATGAPRSQTLRWIRRMWWRTYLLYAVCIVVAIILGPPTWLWILIGVSVVMVIASQLSLAARIHRLERAEQSTTDDHR